MEFPANLKYTESHEWALIEGESATVGITDYAQDQLGDIVFVGLPEVGDDVVAGEAFSDVESVKAVSEMYSPVSGVVAEINEALLDDPAEINNAPYDAWFIKVDLSGDMVELMDVDAYQEHCENEEH